MNILHKDGRSEEPEMTSVEQKEVSIEALSEFMTSDEFVARLQLLPDLDWRSSMIDRVMKFYSLFRRIPTLEEQRSFDIADVVASELGTSPNSTDEKDLNAVRAWINDRLFVNAYYMHCFNGSWEDSVRENGLSRNFDGSLTTREELDDIKRLINNEDGALLNQSSDRIFYDVFMSYHYALNSPEWFYLLTGSYFVDRDIEKSRKFIDAVCKDNCLSETDTIKLKSFFERCWSVLTGESSQPKVALINSAYLLREDVNIPLPEYADNYIEYLESNPYYLAKEKKTVRDLVETCLNGISIGNKSVSFDIPATELQIVDLPGFKDVCPEKII